MVYKIRPHHGLCIYFFRGKGYSQEFINNMGLVKKKLENNPLIELVNYVDLICHKCPNNMNFSKCKDEPKINKLDEKVLFFTNLNYNTNIDWNLFQTIIIDKILKTNNFESVCKHCSWFNFCFKLYKKMNF